MRKKSGVVDHYANDDTHALNIARNIVANLNQPKRVDLEYEDPVEPNYATEELDGIVPADLKQQYDAREIIARLVDGSAFDEFKTLFGPTLVNRLRTIAGHSGRDPRQ